MKTITAFVALTILASTAAAQGVGFGFQATYRTDSVARTQAGPTINRVVRPAGSVIVPRTGATESTAVSPVGGGVIASVARRYTVSEDTASFFLNTIDVVSVVDDPAVTPRIGVAEPSELVLRLSIPGGSAELSLSGFVRRNGMDPGAAQIDVFDDGVIDFDSALVPVGSAVIVPLPDPGLGPRTVDVVLSSSLTVNGSGAAFANLLVELRPTGVDVRRVPNPGICSGSPFLVIPNLDGGVELRGSSSLPTALIIGFAPLANPVVLPLQPPGPPGTCALLVRADATGLLGRGGVLELRRPQAALIPFRAFIQGLQLTGVSELSSAGTFQLDFLP